VETITIVLNGIEVSGYPGTSILDLALESGVYIPTLCYDANLASVGACRLCLVEDERNGALLASCVTPIAPGMIIKTNSPRVVEHRKKILKLMLASHPDSCLVCDKGNRCQLRKLAAEMGIGQVEYQRIPQADVIEEVNPFIERDRSKCIMCGKCIRVDQELVVEGAIDYMHRGTAVKPATWNDTPLEKSECTFCGACVAVCPTGAIMEKDRRYTGTATNMVTTVCPYCGCGCTLSLGIKDGRVVYARPAEDAAVNRGTLCVRGSYGCDFIHSPERLRRPLIKVNGEFKEATWEEALTRVADELKRIKGSHGNDALAVYGSSKCTNEENYLLQRFTRAVLGTNNIDNGSRLYNVASRRGLGATIGYAGTTGSLSSLEQSKVIMVIGADPDTSAPAVNYAIKRAARFKGTELIVVDPRRIRLANFAHLWLRPAIGTDIALLNGLSRVIVGEKKHDVEFVTRMTDNFGSWVKSLEFFTPVKVEEITGVPRKDIQTAARMLAGAEKASIVYGNGITQQINGTGAVIAIANLAMLTGQRGNIFALQRENNAHGACDMGALPNFLPGYQSLDDTDIRKKYEERWGRPLPAGNGMNVLEMIKQAGEGKIKGMLIMGENPLASFPQPTRVAKAISSLDFLVVLDMFMTETAKLAAVVLPSASFAEKEGTFTNFEGRIQRLYKAIEPVGESRSDGEIIRQLAAAMGSPLPYNSAQQVIDEIEEMVPFYHYSTYTGADTKGLEASEMDSGTAGTRRLYKGLFPSGFGRFTVAEYTGPENPKNNDYPFTLMIGSGRYHFNTGSRTSRSARLSQCSSEAHIEVSPSDAKQMGLNNSDKVRIISPQAELITTAKISDTLPPGLLYLPLSSPTAPVYELFDTNIDERHNAPALKVCNVKLERAADNG
jgi:formate dehydrogenase alpha subunit